MPVKLLPSGWIVGERSLYLAQMIDQGVSRPSRMDRWQARSPGLDAWVSAPYPYNWVARSKGLLF